jgi:hypothetical protein
MNKKQLFLLAGFLLFTFCAFLLYLYVSKQAGISSDSISNPSNSVINESIKPLEGEVTKSQLEIEEIQNPTKIIYRLRVSASEPIFVVNNIIKGGFYIKGERPSPKIYFVFGSVSSESIMIGQKDAEGSVYKTVDGKTFLELVKNKKDFMIQVSVPRNQINDEKSYLVQQQEFYTLVKDLTEQGSSSLPEPYEFTAEGILIE